MSVNTWERSLSSIAFLWETHLLNQNISKMIANAPKKYKDSYSDYIIRSGLETFDLLYRGNSIYVGEFTPDADFKERKKLFREGMSKLATTLSAANIFLEHMRQSDGVNNDTVNRYSESLGARGDNIKNLVISLIKSDEKRQSEIKANKKAKKAE